MFCLIFARSNTQITCVKFLVDNYISEVLDRKFPKVAFDTFLDVLELFASFGGVLCKF